MVRAILLLAAVGLAAQDGLRVIEARCAGCHNAAAKQGGLDLSTREAALRGGKNGAAIRPGSAGESLLMKHVTGALKPVMPLGSALSEAERLALSAWIDRGATYSAPVTVAQHWAFQPVVRPRVPGGGNPIDAFLAREQQRHNAAPAEEADRHTLLRRVTLDLTGVPPAPEEIRAFIADGSYERAVDRLLASPRYGERWARHWMDIWRYSDWYGSGPEVRNSQPHIWRWRDWIVESLNANKSYGTMVREMIAGDEISPADPRGTGFLVRNWFLFNRNVWLQDTIEGVTAGFLGLTLKCARCHDHKYDPLSQEEYYRFRAYFEPHDVRIDRVPGEADTKKAGLARAFDAAPREDISNAAGTFLQPAIFPATYLFINGDERNPDRTRPLTPGTPSILGAKAGEPRAVELTREAYYPDSRGFVQKDLLAAADARIVQVEREIAAARARLAKPDEPVKTEAVDFEKVIKPLLEARCAACHSARNIKSGFNIASARSVQNGGSKHGAAAIPGDSKSSPLLQLVRGEKQPRMPLNAPPLQGSEIAKLAAWVDSLPLPSRATVERGLAVSEKELATARAKREALAARIDAENKAGSAELARSKEREASAAQARESILRAQQRLDDAALDDGKIAAAKRALEQAVEALANPKESYSPLGPVYPKQSTGRRTALAEWMTARENPLTARVAVNHIWLRHFGAALVPSVVDFGRNGKAPTHPELLDWLAAEFMESGWDMKRLHRLMVTSDAYKRRVAEGGDNRWYTHANPRRLEAEAIRDSVLHVARALDFTMGGPELNEDVHANTPRRSLYFRLTPDAQLEFLRVFDGVDPTNCFVRTESVAPQQALALANSRLSLVHARMLASQIDNVEDAFLRVLGRPPSRAEVSLSEAFLKTHADAARGRANLIHALFNRNEFVTIR
jgi:mono/diheme cytochrome c family protein